MAVLVRCGKCGCTYLPTQPACPFCSPGKIKIAQQMTKGAQKPKATDATEEKPAGHDETAGFCQDLHPIWRKTADRITTDKNKLILIAWLLGCFILGYFVGSGYQEYEPEKTVETAFSGIAQGFKELSSEVIKAVNRIRTKSITKRPKEEFPITVSLLEKQSHEEDSLRNEDSRDKIRLAFTNHSESNLRAFTGAVIFYDLFDRKIHEVPLTHYTPVASGDTTIWTGTIHYDEFDDADRALRSTAKEDLSLDFIVKEVIYSDGTRESF